MLSNWHRLHYSTCRSSISGWVAKLNSTLVQNINWHPYLVVSDYIVNIKSRNVKCFLVTCVLDKVDYHTITGYFEIMHRWLREKYFCVYVIQNHCLVDYIEVIASIVLSFSDGAGNTERCDQPSTDSSPPQYDQLHGITRQAAGSYFPYFTRLSHAVTLVWISPCMNMTTSSSYYWDGFWKRSGNNVSDVGKASYVCLVVEWQHQQNSSNVQYPSIDNNIT